VEGVSMDEHGTHALESACGSPSVRRSQMWNGDLNRPRAKTTNQMIVGTTDVKVKQQSTSITLGSGESTTVARVPWWGGSVDGEVHGVWAML